MKPELKKIRQDMLHIAKESGHGHIPSSFSVAEILYAIYEVMKHDPNNPSWRERDMCILSKGHAALAHYCILAHFGYFDIKKVHAFGTFMSNFGCHADRLKVAGIEVSCGSLGHGIGIAVGIALGFKIRKEDRRIFVVVGDGEANEGSVWEALMVAVNLKLNNLTIVYDNNLSHLRGLQIRDPAAKFKAFGCEVAQVDGHDVEILKAQLKLRSDSVRAIIAHTKKGFGCKTFVENHYEWHRKSPTDDEFRRLMGELDEEAV